MPESLANTAVIEDVQDSAANDWRKEDSPSDLLFALDTYYSFENFTGRAAIYDDATAESPLDIDYIITNIDLNLDEHIQVSEHVGNSFGVICFGKAPLQVTFSGVLADTQKTFGKRFLIDAYKNKLRLGAVARTGIIPVVKFGNHALHGPFISMRITENSMSEDTLTVIMTMFVTEMQVIGEDEPIVFDYVHGVESETNSAMMARSSETRMESGNDTEVATQQTAGEKLGSTSQAANAESTGAKQLGETSGGTAKPPHAKPSAKSASSPQGATPDYQKMSRQTAYDALG
jgi:hypothetical protein